MKNRSVPLLTFAVALLMIWAGSPPRPLHARRTFRDHSGSGGCTKDCDPKILCADHESSSFQWEFEIGGDVKAVVIAFTETDFVKTFTASGAFVLGTGTQTRTDVKEKIRGWCQTFASVEEAQKAEQKVAEQLAKRKVLINQHKEVRLKIHGIEEKIDKRRSDEDTFFDDLVGVLDEFEIANTNRSTFSEIVKDRAKMLKKGNDYQTASQNMIAAFESQIADQEGEDDGILKKVDLGPDAAITGILGNPVECVVVELESLKFEKVEDNPKARTPDANPNFRGGQRIIPDGDRVGEAPQQDVQVTAIIKPKKPGVTIHFKAFDVDDPLSDRGEYDSTGNRGGDNYNGVRPRLNGGAETADAITDANGKAKVILTVSLLPGDNFMAVAECDPDKVNKYNDDDASNNAIPKRINTDRLTVWRRVFFESESMRAVPLSNQRHRVEGRIVASAVLGNGTAQTDIEPADAVVLADSQNRFENGLLSIDLEGFRTFEVVSSQTVNNVIRLVVRTYREDGFEFFPPSSPPNVHVFLHDDDFKYEGGRVQDRGLLPFRPLEMDQTKAIYRDAYLDIKDGPIPGFDLAQQTRADLNPLLNVDDGAVLMAQFMEDNFSSMGARSPHFWIGYLCSAFQGLRNNLNDVGGDSDPNDEVGGFGLTMYRPAGNGFSSTYGSFVFMETSRDLGEILRFNAGQNVFKRSKTVAHEFGHQWGLDDGSGGLMTTGVGDGTSADVFHSSPLLLDQLRTIRTRPEGPGPAP